MNSLKDLTPSEARVAEIISRGYSNTDAAKVLGCAEKTVKFHLTNIYKKTGLKTRTRLALKVFNHKVAEPIS